MRTVPIQVARNDGTQEWAIIELQGSIHYELDDADTDAPNISAKPFGELTFDAEERPQLRIGQNQLTGKKKTLEKPLAILTKEARDDQTTLVLHHIVRTKYIFSSGAISLVRKKFIGIDKLN